MDDVVTEHAVEMTSGAMLVRWSSPELERIAPLAEWIEHRYTIDGTKVYQRRIVVVEDWKEVPRG